MAGDGWPMSSAAIGGSSLNQAADEQGERCRKRLPTGDKENRDGPLSLARNPVGADGGSGGVAMRRSRPSGVQAPIPVSISPSIRPRSKRDSSPGSWPWRGWQKKREERRGGGRGYLFATIILPQFLIPPGGGRLPHGKRAQIGPD